MLSPTLSSAPVRRPIARAAPLSQSSGERPARPAPGAGQASRATDSSRIGRSRATPSSSPRQAALRRKAAHSAGLSAASAGQSPSGRNSSSPASSPGA